MGNPNVNQGTLNRLRGNIVIPNFPSLNVTASNLGEGGMSLAFEGNAALMINTLTGRVTSPEPYIPAAITVPMLRTQSLANLYKKQMESNCLIGDVTLYPDTSVMDPYTLVNCTIEKVENITVSGKDPVITYSIAGTYQVNSQLYTL